MGSHNDALLTAALDYIAHGLTVIALNGKAPNTKVHPHGLLDWDVDMMWAFQHPDTTGIGILCNAPLIVVDIDGEEGAQAWREMAGEDWLPESWVAKTGRGLHMYMGTLVTTGTLKLAEKLDLKGQGGYVAAPPSRHPSGHMYEWLQEPTPMLPQAPEFLERIIERAKAERDIRQKVDRPLLKNRQRKSFENGTFYPVATFDGIIGRVRNEAAGNRNNLTYWAARTILEEGGDPEDLEALGEAAVEAGLATREVRTAIRSAVRGK